MEQDLLTLPELLSKWICVAQSLLFCVMFCRSFSVPLSFFLFGHGVVLLRFMDSDYACGILDLRILITPLVS